MNIRQGGPSNTWYISNSVEGKHERNEEYKHSQAMFAWLEDTFGPPDTKRTSSKIWEYNAYNFSTALGLPGFTWTVYFYDDAAASAFLLRWS